MKRTKVFRRHEEVVYQVRVEDEVGAALLVTGVVWELALLLLLLVEPVPDLVFHPLVQVGTLDNSSAE